MDTRWYLHAINDNAHTNEILASIIGRQVDEALSHDTLCADGQRRNLYRCPSGYQDVRKAVMNYATYNLKMAVFQQAPDGSIVEYTLWKPAVKKRSLMGRLKRRIWTPK